MTIVITGSPTDTDVINVLYGNVFNATTLSYSTQTTGKPAANIYDDATWNVWLPTAVPAYIKADFGTAVSCNSCGIAAHDLGTSGATVEIQWSTDNSNWNTIYGYSAITDEDVLIIWSAVSARYWQIYVTGAAANIGHVKIGARLAFPVAPLSGHKPLHHARQYTMLSNESMGGNLLGNRVTRVGATSSVDVGLIDRDFAENDLLPFEVHYNEGKSFFYCGSPSDLPKDMGYCWRPEGSGEMNITLEEGDILAQVDFEVKSYVST